MTDTATAVHACNPVTIEDSARYDGDLAPVLRVAGDPALVELTAEGLFVTTAIGLRMPVPLGFWVVRFGPGDIGVMSAGAYQRWFGRRDEEGNRD